jgi:CubicO group peptidase (beta-lactamase class C family)
MPDRDRLAYIPRDHLPFHLPLTLALGLKLSGLMRTVTTPDGNKPAAPGCIFMVRRDGQPFVTLGRGWARLPIPGASAPPVDEHLPMTEDTVVHIASMAKPICAAAVVALMDDWNELKDGLANLPSPPTAEPPNPVDSSVVPPLLRPLFDDPRLAMRVDTASMQRIPAPWRPWVQAAADRERAHPSVPWRASPFQGGLLLSVLRVGGALDGDSLLMDLILPRLRAESAVTGAIVTSTARNLTTTLKTLLWHESGLRDESDTDGVAVEPEEGLAVYPLWQRVINVLGDGTPFEQTYRNSNYTILGAMIEAVTEVRYADWVRYRVIGDVARFPSIERRAAPHALAARYYGEDVGTGDPAALAGTYHSDYTNWGANGGFYVTAAQFTDWMYALYAGLQVRGGKAIVSAAGRDLLFGARPFFSGGSRLAGPSGGGTLYFGFEKNGGTGVNGGSCNGVLKIFTPQAGGPVYTAFLLANGPVKAEDLFNPMFDALMAELP